MGPFIRYAREAIVEVRDAYFANPQRYKFTRDDDRRKGRFERPSDQFRKRRDRDAEAFEEGYKYELEQSAKLQQQLAQVAQLASVRSKPLNEVDAAFQDFDDDPQFSQPVVSQAVPIASRFQFTHHQSTTPPAAQPEPSDTKHAQQARPEKVFLPPPDDLVRGTGGRGGGGVPLPRSANAPPQASQPAASVSSRPAPRTGFYDAAPTSNPAPTKPAAFFDPAIVQATPAAAQKAPQSQSAAIASLLSNAKLRASGSVVSGTVDASQLEASILGGKGGAAAATGGWAVTSDAGPREQSDSAQRGGRGGNPQRGGGRAGGRGRGRS